MIPIITTPLFTRLMTTAEYGASSTFTTWFTVLNVICSLNLWYSVGRAKLDFPGKLEEYVASVMLLALLFCSILGGAAFLLLDQVTVWLEMDKALVIALIIYLLAYPAVQLTQTKFKYQYNYKGNIWITIYTKMDFNAAIFDLDGTILDSMDVWEHIDIQFLKKRNLPVPENYVTEICARSFEEAAQYTIDLFGLQETVEGIIEEWNNMAVEEYSNHVGLLPHALDYLLRLKEHGIKLAVATGLPEKLYIPCLKNNSILELFDALCSTDEVQRGKEYSDVFELAARKLGVAPEHCIVFDDVLPAIKSAKAARMLAGGIYDKYSADQRTEIERIADIYLLDFRQAPIPHKEV